MFPQPPTPAGTPEPAIQPLHDFAIPAGFSGDGEALISPDGLTAYIVRPDHSINLWDLASWFWPEIVLVGASMCFAWALLTVYRRRPQRPLADDGNPAFYCRWCNYPLPAPGSQPKRCPECGADLIRKPSVKGRRAVMRLVPAGLVFAIALSAALLVWTLNTNVRTALRGLCNWHSTTAFEYFSARPNIPIPKWVVVSGTVLDQIDIPTGKTRHQYHLANNPNFYPLTMAPGGRFIAFQGAQGYNGSPLTLIDTVALRSRTVAHLPGTYKSAGLSSDGKRFYFAEMYGPVQLTQLDTESGKLGPLRKWPAFDRAFSRGWASVIDQDGKVTEAYFGELGGGSGSGDWSVVYHLFSSSGEQSGEFGEDDMTAQDNILDAEKRVLHIGASSHGAGETRVFDLQTGQVTPSKQKVGLRGPLQDCGSPLIFETTPQSINVSDRSTGAPVCTLAMNASDLLIRAQLSEDRRFIVAFVQANAPQGELRFGMMGVAPTSIRVWRFPKPFKPTP